MSEETDGVSIKRRMLVFLVCSALLMVSGATAVTYLVALHSANNAYDRLLLDPAFDISSNVRIDGAGPHIDLPKKALEALVYDQVDKVVFQVRADDGTVVDGVPDLPPPPAIEPGHHAFFDVSYDAEPMRVAALRTDSGLVIQIAETLHKRNRLIAEMLASELVPTVFVALASIALAWLGMSQALRPIGRLRDDLLSRTPADLRSLRNGGTPVEIAPVVSAFNDLLASLRHAKSIQQRILANAAHQLRTPLAGLQMHLELLLRRPLATEVRTELERMETATTRAGRLANQLLALAKAESGPGQPDDRGVVDLQAIAGSAARDWTPTAFSKNIDLGFSLEHAPIVGDPVLLPEMLDNLIDNALRYTPPGGHVTVSTGLSGDAAFLIVEDNGPGIPTDERQKVLERFYRIAGTPGDGSGLGLAIVREVVDRHGGEIEISAGHDTGTRVRVTFPPEPRAVAA